MRTITDLGIKVKSQEDREEILSLMTLIYLLLENNFNRWRMNPGGYALREVKIWLKAIANKRKDFIPGLNVKLYHRGSGEDEKGGLVKLWKMKLVG